MALAMRNGIGKNSYFESAGAVVAAAFRPPWVCRSHGSWQAEACRYANNPWQAEASKRVKVAYYRREFRIDNGRGGTLS